MNAWGYETDCTHSTGPLITAMQDAAKAITRRTFLRYVDRAHLTAIEGAFGYDVLHQRGGLRMSTDPRVGYYRSTYDGVPCVYFEHSRIEHIYTERAGWKHGTWAVLEEGML